MYGLYKANAGDTSCYLLVHEGKAWMFTPPYIETALQQIKGKHLSWDFDEAEYVDDWDRVDETFNSDNEVRMYMLLEH